VREERSRQSKGLFVRTFGCQMNRYDSERLVELLREEGYEPVADEGQADLVVINTCSVRDKAEQKAFSYLGRLKAVKRRRPDVVIAIAGCVAQQNGAGLLDRVPHLDLVVGTHGLAQVPRLLGARAETGKRQCFVDFMYDFGDRPDGARRPQAPAVSAYVTIMRGCDNYCTYCIVPQVRGRERSRPVREIVGEVESLVASGVKEVVLLGQNVNSYGKGLPGSADFAALLHEVAKVPGVMRIRFTTSHPKDLSPALMGCFAEIEPLCPHIHLPVQSGSDRILTRMRRGYTREHFLRRVEELRRVRADVAISSDVIVGFPGEIEADFHDTMALLEAVRFDALFSFMYSDRPGTPARGLRGKVPSEVKLQRLQSLQSLQERITLERNEAQVGTITPVLVEGASQAGEGQLTGRSPQNRVVNFSGQPDLAGREVPVLISTACPHSLQGVVAIEGHHPLPPVKETSCYGK
jgi:tRNA-2-methylthio-N6-dimethylallyladenosine synthase